MTSLDSNTDPEAKNISDQKDFIGITNLKKSYNPPSRPFQAQDSCNNPLLNPIPSPTTTPLDLNMNQKSKDKIKKTQMSPLNPNIKMEDIINNLDKNKNFPSKDSFCNLRHSLNSKNNKKSYINPQSSPIVQYYSQTSMSPLLKNNKNNLSLFNPSDSLNETHRLSQDLNNFNNFSLEDQYKNQFYSSFNRDNTSPVYNSSPGNFFNRLSNNSNQLNTSNGNNSSNHMYKINIDNKDSSGNGESENEDSENDDSDDLKENDQIDESLKSENQNIYRMDFISEDNSQYSNISSGNNINNINNINNFGGGNEIGNFYNINTMGDMGNVNDNNVLFNMPIQNAMRNRFIKYQSNKKGGVNDNKEGDVEDEHKGEHNTNNDVKDIDSINSINNLNINDNNLDKGLNLNINLEGDNNNIIASSEDININNFNLEPNINIPKENNININLNPISNVNFNQSENEDKTFQLNPLMANEIFFPKNFNHNTGSSENDNEDDNSKSLQKNIIPDLSNNNQVIQSDQKQGIINENDQKNQIPPSYFYFNQGSSSILSSSMGSMFNDKGAESIIKGSAISNINININNNQFKEKDDLDNLENKQCPSINKENNLFTSEIDNTDNAKEKIDNDKEFFDFNSQLSNLNPVINNDIMPSSNLKSNNQNVNSNSKNVIVNNNSLSFNVNNTNNIIKEDNLPQMQPQNINLMYNNSNVNVNNNINNKNNTLNNADKDLSLSKIPKRLKSISTKQLEKIPINEIVHNLLTYSKDQTGCRYLQKLLDDNPELASLYYPKIIENIFKIINDPFGNYLLQKIFPYLPPPNIHQILFMIAPYFYEIGCNPHGTRVLQSLINHLKTIKLVEYFLQIMTPYIIPLLKDLNGTHIVQIFANRYKNYEKYINKIIVDNSPNLSTHRHGCCVVQKYLEVSEPEMKNDLLDKLTENCLMLIIDQFGNYVLQAIFQMNITKFNNVIGLKISDNICYYAKHKYSTNVVEKCFDYCDGNVKQLLMINVLKNEAINDLILDEHGNYVLQKAILQLDQNTQKIILNKIVPLFEKLKLLPFGERVISRLIDCYPHLLDYNQCFKSFPRGKGYKQKNKKFGITNNNFNPVLYGNNNPNMNMNYLLPGYNNMNMMNMININNFNMINNNNNGQQMNNNNLGGDNNDQLSG